MKFAREHYGSDLVEEMRPLWTRHYQEIATFKDIPLSPNLDAYEAMDKLGTLRIYTARLEEGIIENELVGYLIVFVNYGTHYSKSKQANMDILYLDKAFRRGLNGYKFIRWVCEELKAEDVQVLYFHVKKAFDFEAIMKRLGFVDHDITYAKRLN